MNKIRILPNRAEINKKQNVVTRWFYNYFKRRHELRINHNLPYFYVAFLSLLTPVILFFCIYATYIELMYIQANDPVLKQEEMKQITGIVTRVTRSNKMQDRVYLMTKDGKVHKFHAGVKKHQVDKIVKKEVIIWFQNSYSYTYGYHPALHQLQVIKNGYLLKDFDKFYQAALNRVTARPKRVKRFLIFMFYWTIYIVWINRFSKMKNQLRKKRKKQKQLAMEKGQ